MHTETPVPLSIREHQRITDEIERQSEESTLVLFCFGLALCAALWLMLVIL